MTNHQADLSAPTQALTRSAEVARVLTNIHLGGFWQAYIISSSAWFRMCSLAEFVDVIYRESRAIRTALFEAEAEFLSKLHTNNN